MRFDCHMHTYLCGHAQGRPEEYVKQASDRAIDLVTFTCHIQIEGSGFLQDGIRMNRGELPTYKRLVERAREYGNSVGVEVLFGIEAEVFPEKEKLGSMEEVLNSENFDFILGSLHHQLPVFRRWLSENQHDSDQAKIHAYFLALAEGASSGLYHSMSHPDVIRIYGTVDSFEPIEHKEVIKHFLDTLVTNKVHMEVNTSGLTKGVYKLHPDPLILEWAQESVVELTLGSDSHRPNQVGLYFPQVLTLLKNTGFETVSYFKQGEAKMVSIEEILYDT